MPLPAPQALSNDEVYAVTAYLLHLCVSKTSSGLIA